MTSVGTTINITGNSNDSNLVLESPSASIIDNISSKDNNSINKSPHITYNSLINIVKRDIPKLLNNTVWFKNTDHETDYKTLCDSTGQNILSTGSGYEYTHRILNNPVIAGSCFGSNNEIFFTSFPSGSIIKYQNEKIIDFTFLIVKTKIPKFARTGLASILGTILPEDYELRCVAAPDDVCIVGNYLFVTSLLHVIDDPLFNDTISTMNPVPDYKKFDKRYGIFLEGNVLNFGQVYRFDLRIPLAGQTPIKMINIEDVRNSINGICTDGTFVYATTSDGGANENKSISQVYAELDYFNIPHIDVSLIENADTILFQPGRFYKINGQDEGNSNDTIYRDYKFSDMGIIDELKSKSFFSNGCAIKDGWIYCVISDAGHSHALPLFWNKSSHYKVVRIKSDLSGDVQILCDAHTYSLGTRIYNNKCVTIFEDGKLMSFKIPESTDSNPSINLKLVFDVSKSDWYKNTNYKYAESYTFSIPFTNYFPPIYGGIASLLNPGTLTLSGLNKADYNIPQSIDQILFDKNGKLYWFGIIPFFGTFENILL